MSGFEANFDGLVGPTHHYAGLSVGNEASQNNRDGLSNPKKAALQGLYKMKTLADRGFVQGILPPQPRPNMTMLRSIGFQGSDEQVIQRAAKEAPQLLSAFSSASSMWTANAATVSPSADSADGKVHFTVANLNNKLHRMQEAPITSAILRATFADERYFAHHAALPQHGDLGDEGAANHNRFCGDYDRQGVQFLSTVSAPAAVLRQQNTPHARRWRPAKRWRVCISSTRSTPYSLSKIRRLSTMAYSTMMLSPSATATCCSIISTPSCSSGRCWQR